MYENKLKEEFNDYNRMIVNSKTYALLFWLQPLEIEEYDTS